MKIHHLSCGCMCPFGGFLMDGISSGLGPAKLVCHCLLVETEQGLVLIDTGFGLQDVRHPKDRIATFFRNLNRPLLKEEHTAVRQIARLGFLPQDVRHIVLTHLDFDHAGGLSDFPQATVHIMESEVNAARRAKGPIQGNRFSPQQWGDSKAWEQYNPKGESWFGFEAVRGLKGLPPEILLVPLVGHTEGHAGVAVQTESGWLLLAGDAYFHHGQIRKGDGPAPMGSVAYQYLMDTDRMARQQNLERLQLLERDHNEDVLIFCSHDRTEFEALQSIKHRLAHQRGSLTDLSHAI